MKQNRIARCWVAGLAIAFAMSSLSGAQIGSALKDKWKRESEKLTHPRSGNATTGIDTNNELPGTYHNPVPVIKDIVVSGSEQFVASTTFRIDLFAILKRPELLTDAFVAKFVETQVGAEQNAYNFLTSPKNHLPLIKRYEYQTYLAAQPQFANTALLRTFLYPQADWSWMKDRPQDDDFYTVVFLYSQDKLLGREPAFLVRDLAPLTKQTLLIASQHAPHLVWKTLRLPDWKYDPSSDTIRFLSNNQAAPFLEGVDPLQPAPNEGFRGVKEVPRKAEYPSYYTTAGINENKFPGSFQPGRCTSACPTTTFREQSTTFADSAAKFPSFGLLILDHKTVIKGINIHAAEAEALTQAHAKISARIMLEFDDLAIAENASTPTGQESFRTLAIYAKVRSIDFVDENANVLSSIPGSELETGSVFSKPLPFVTHRRLVTASREAETRAGSVPAQSPMRMTSSMTPDERRRQQQERLRQARLAQCQRYSASRFPDTESEDYKNAYTVCIAKLSARAER